MYSVLIAVVTPFLHQHFFLKIWTQKAQVGYDICPNWQILKDVCAARFYRRMWPKCGRHYTALTKVYCIDVGAVARGCSEEQQIHSALCNRDIVPATGTSHQRQAHYICYRTFYQLQGILPPTEHFTSNRASYHLRNILPATGHLTTYGTFYQQQGILPPTGHFTS